MERSQGPGSLSVHILDELLLLSPADFARAQIALKQAEQEVSATQP